ncbi:MAG: YqgE/AlgH family protein [Gammaproteobacteria bacterium]
MTQFANQFMIAMPGLLDPGFTRTVTIICEHNDQGALGLVINRPSDLNVGDLLEQMELGTDDPELASQPVMQGGPVSRDRGFVLHEEKGPWESTMSVSNKLQLTTSKDILEAIAEGKGPARTIMAVGYAGWDAGQLESEMGANSWLSADYDADILFETPVKQRWSAAAGLLGIDPHQISSEAGHA